MRVRFRSRTSEYVGGTQKATNGGNTFPILNSPPLPTPIPWAIYYEVINFTKEQQWSHPVSKGEHQPYRRASKGEGLYFDASIWVVRCHANREMKEKLNLGSCKKKI